MKDRLAPPSMLKNIQQHLPEWIEQAPEMPKLIHDAFSQLRNRRAYPKNPTRGTSYIPRRNSHQSFGVIF